MVLSTPVPRGAIINDTLVSDFTNDPTHRQPDEEKLQMMQRHYMLSLVEGLFDFSVMRFAFSDTVRCLREYFYNSHPKTYSAWMEASDRMKSIEDVARRFHLQYSNIIMTVPECNDNALLQERLRKGAEYFSQEIVFVGSLLVKTSLPTENKQARERINNLLQAMQETYKQKTKLLLYVAKEGFVVQDYLKKKAKIMLEQ